MMTILTILVFIIKFSRTERFVVQHKHATKCNKKYNEVTVDIFDMSKVRSFKEIEKKRWGMFFFMSSVS